MEEFFCDFFYYPLAGLCGKDLDDYMAGWDSAANTFYNFGQTSYPFMGLLTIGIALVVCAIYYYSPLTNRPTFNRWYHWLLTGLAGGTVMLIVGTVSCNNAIVSGDVARALGITEPDMLPSLGNCLGFGLEELILTFVCYFVFSLIIKWKSVNCKYTPF